MKSARVCGKCRLGQRKRDSWRDHRLNVLVAFASVCVASLLGGFQIHLASQRLQSAEDAKSKAEAASEKAEAASNSAQNALNRVLTFEGQQRPFRNIQTLLSRVLDADSREAYDELKAISKNDPSGEVRANALSAVTDVRQKFWMPRGARVLADVNLLPRGTTPCDARAFLKNANPNIRIAALGKLAETGNWFGNREWLQAILSRIETDKSMKVLDFIGQQLFLDGYRPLGTTIEFGAEVADINRRLRNSQPVCLDK